ncbi:MAG TPA: hypothetical protein VGM09_32495 [Bradyrhizobium sp.]
MRKFHSIAALRGDGLRPELQALFDRMAADPHSELVTRHDGMTQSGPDPVSETADVVQQSRKELPDLFWREHPNLGREPIKSDWSADVRFGAHSGPKPDIV